MKDEAAVKGVKMAGGNEIERSTSNVQRPTLK